MFKQQRVDGLRFKYGQLFNLCCISVFIGLAGCASAPAPVEESRPSASKPVMVEPQKAEPQKEPVQPATPQSRKQIPEAAKRLLRASEAAYSSGRWSTSIQLAERSLRIAPAQPGAYLLLAKAYLGLGEGGLASQMARKGLSWRPRGRLKEQLEMIATP